MCLYSIHGCVVWNFDVMCTCLIPLCNKINVKVYWDFISAENILELYMSMSCKPPKLQTLTKIEYNLKKLHGSVYS